MDKWTIPICYQKLHVPKFYCLQNILLLKKVHIVLYFVCISLHTNESISAHVILPLSSGLNKIPRQFQQLSDFDRVKLIVFAS